MDLGALKGEFSRQTMQIARLDRQGLLLDSDHTLLDLSGFIGQTVLSEFAIFVGLEATILKLSEDDSPLAVPLVNFVFQDQEHLVTFEFHARGGEIIWVMFDNHHFLPRLQDMQQQRNDSILLLDRIRQQEQELRTAYERLERANEELDRFAFVISHDLKTPLRGIRNLSQWIAEDIAEGDFSQLPAHIELLQARSLRMKQLIDAVLKYSRVGREVPVPEEVDIALLLESIVSELDLRDQAIFQSADYYPILLTHSVWLRQIFSNLLSNALKYSAPTEKVIAVKAVQKNATWTFTVEDNGPGIPEADRARIFDLFETLSGTSDYENTGLGLAIVRKLVLQNGGAIAVGTSSLGGASFQFTWPVT